MGKSATTITKTTHLRPQTMRHRRQEAIRIRRQIHPRQLGLQIQHRADEGRVLVREPVVLLPGPGGGFLEEDQWTE